MSENRKEMRSAELDCAILVPVYRNAATLDELARRVTETMATLDLSYRLLFIVDASPDDSWNVIKRLADSDTHICGLLLGRNEGQHRALLAGFRHIHARWTAVMDADLQDPPELLANLITECRRTDVSVFARRNGLYQDAGRMLSSRLYKCLLGYLVGLPMNVGTYFVTPMQVAQAIRSAKVQHVSLVVMARIFSQGWSAVFYRRNVRMEGQSAYSTWGRLCSAGMGLLCVVECHFYLWQRGRLKNLTILPQTPVAGRVNI